MTAEIYNIRDYQNKRDFDRLQADQAKLEQMASSLLNYALLCEPVYDMTGYVADDDSA